MTPATIHLLEIAAIVVTGTMTGNEIAVAVFFHPRISRLEDPVHARAARTLARGLGAVMPFWYGLAFLLSLAMTFVAYTGWLTPRWLALGSTALFGLYDRLYRAFSSAHQQPGCSLAAGFVAR
jgi:hypothetical protein